MKKLKLEIDALRVESFDTVKKEDGARGTVRGHVHSSCGEVCTCDCIDENTSFVPFAAVAGDPLFAPAIVSTDQPLSCMDSFQDC